MIYYTCKVFGNLYDKHELVRQLLCKHRDPHWAWMADWIETFTYERELKGNPEVYTRTVAKGRTARKLQRASLLAIDYWNSMQNVRVIVKGAGTEEVNGVYEFDGYFEPGASEQVDTVTPKWCKCAHGKRLTLYRCRVKDRNFTWYISILSEKPGTNRDTDFYSSQKTQPATMPPIVGWSMCKKAEKPPPKIQIITTDFDVEKDPCIYCLDGIGNDPTEESQGDVSMTDTTDSRNMSMQRGSEVSSSPMQASTPEHDQRRSYHFFENDGGDSEYSSSNSSVV